MHQALNRIFAEFASNPVASGKAMRGLLESDREQFVLSSLPILRAVQQNQAFSYLLTLLLMNDLILEPLTNPDVFSFEEAVDLARALLKIEPLLDIKMVRTLLDTKGLSSREELEKRVNTERGIRLLEVMAAISDGGRILSVMAQLLRHPNSNVRSKAALLVGRSNKNYQWVEQRLLEPDPRVRANALESLWGVDSEGARQVLWVASADPDNRAAGNAIYGLYQLGEAGSIPLMLGMLDHAQEDFRATAVWIMGETGDPRFLPVLANLMSDSESRIRAAVFRAIAKLKKNAAKHLGQPNLDLYVGPTEQLGGTRHLRVSVCAHTASAGGPGDYTGSPTHALTALKPTQFVIHEGATLISEYEVLEEAHPESLSIAFALPRVVETKDALHRALELAFPTALRHKRKNDGWLTLRYSCDSPAKQRVVSRSSTMSILRINSTYEAPPAKPAPLSLPPDMRFSTEPEAILSAVANPVSRLSAAPGVISAAQMLIASLASARGSRHLVLLCQDAGSNVSPEESLEIARAALASKIAIHVIARNVCPALKSLSSRTGGFWLETSAQELPGALGTLCANLTGNYHIRYNLDKPGEGSQFGKIEVFGERGCGKKTFQFTDHSAVQGSVRPDPQEARSLNSRTELATK